MTVQELIDELQKVKDKSLPIIYEDNEYGAQHITEVVKHRRSANDDFSLPDTYYQLQ